MIQSGSSTTSLFSVTENAFFHLMNGESQFAVDRADVDWNEIGELARFHRVEGLISPVLQSREFTESKVVPKDVTEAILSSSKFLVTQTLLRMKTTVEIAIAFDEAGIKFLLMKGEAISLRYYHSAGNRFSKDIDLLISPEDFQRAADAISKIGLRQSKPGFSIDDDCQAAVQSIISDATFVDDTSKINVELHWRLFSNPALIDQPLTALVTNHETIKLAGQSIPVMGSSYQLVYLLAHGAVHAWFRLKWLIDIHMMLKKMSADELQEAKEFASSIGLNKVYEEGLMLHDVFFQQEEPRTPNQDIGPVARYIKRIQQRKTAEVRTLKEIPQFFIDLVHAMSLKSGLIYKAWEIALYFIKIDDVQRFGFGKNWLPFYVVSGAFGRITAASKALFSAKTA